MNFKNSNAMKLQKVRNRDFFPGTFNSFLDDFFNNEEVQTSNYFKPQVDIAENENSYMISLAIPGANKEDFNIDLKDDMLTISGKKERKNEEKEGTKYHRVENFYGSFSRSFTLPDNVNRDAIEAEYKDGLLNLTIPKGEEAKPKNIIVK